ncbi:MAG: UvrD-helicase domain-containing protein, partial [Proteobacteria bacterium]|nr:UvrD-helicase domain-containing protein [Pseudomonadota bacterium]
ELARLRQRHPEASLRPERQASRPVAELALDDWRRLLDAARAAWRDGGRERVRDLVRDRKRVAGKYFRTNSVDGWLDLLGDALERGEPLIVWSIEDGQRDKVERFRASFVEGQAKPGVDLPRIDLLDAMDELLAEEERLESELEGVSIGLARRFADEALDQERDLLRESGRATHDGIVDELYRALQGEGGEALAEALRGEFGAALIDEFQDTDARQYGIFQRVFAGARPAPPLLLIGDPKQAIYSFRGADVFAYLKAKRDAGEAVCSLAVNRRSGPMLVGALNRLYAQADTPFGPEIDYERVEAADDKRDLFGRAAPDGGSVAPGAALELVFVERDNPRSPAPAEARVAARVAAHVAELLARGRLENEPIEPKEVAVLCRTNRQVSAVFEALAARGIGASVRGPQSVAGSEEAAELECVLAALAEPGRAAFVRAALSTRLLGLDAAGLLALDQDEAGWTRWVEAFANAGRRWTECGVLAGAGALFDRTGVRRRLLAGFGGDRAAANLDHLLELCHEAERRERLAPAALLRWLGELRAGLLEEPAEDHRLRLDRESGAVQVGTVHGAKGLEYDVVYVPWAWQPSGGPRADRWWIYHDPGEERRAVLDLGGPERETVQPLAAAEREQEDARLLYVALTRARQRCSVFCAPVGGPFARLLVGEPQRLENALAGLAADSGGAIEVVRDWPGDVAPAAARGHASDTADWRAREPGRPAAVGERTSSFSGLVHGAPEAADPRDLDSASSEDEPLPAESERIPLAELPGGARTGTALHEVFERLDLDAADPESVRSVLDRSLERHGLGGLGEALRSSLGRAVLDALDAPLAGDGGPRLRDLPAPARASELEFWLAARPAAGIEPATLAEVFESHGDPRRVRSYAAHARGLGFARLRGFLRGFVDLVFEHEGRWYVLDYKSNRLGERFSDYAPERLWNEMCARHYVLQYHLYALALHRLLRLRLPGYDYATHFGGAYYLFLRGMAPDRPGHGVYFDCPPAGLMEALDAAVGREGA